MMLRREKIEAEEDEIPDEIIDEVYEKIEPRIKELVKGSIVVTLEEFFKKQLAPILAGMQKRIDAVSKEVDMVKNTTSYNAFFEELLQAHDSVLVKKAVKEVIDSIGLAKIELIETYITEFEEKLHQLKDSLNSLKQEANRMNVQMGMAISEFKSEKDALEGIREELQEFSTRIKRTIETEVELALKELKKSLKIDEIDVSKMITSSAEAAFRETLSKLEERLFTATEDIKHTAESVSGLSVAAESMKSIDERVGKLEEEITEIAKAIRSIEAKLKEGNGSVGSNTSLEAKAKQVKAEQDQMVKNLEEDLDESDAVLSDLET